MIKDVVKQLILDFQEREIPQLTDRRHELKFIKDMCISIAGSRRSGKTYRTYQFVKDFISKGGSLQNICRLQFNDHRVSQSYNKCQKVQSY